MSRKKTTEEIAQEVEKYNYKLVSEYQNAHAKISILCHTHGVFSMKYNSFQQGQRCPKCSHRSDRYTLNEIKRLAQEKGVTLLSKDIFDYHANLHFMCDLHGGFTDNLTAIKRRKFACVKCFSKQKTKPRISYLEVRDYLKQNDYELLTQEKNYTNNRTVLQIQCNKKHVFTTRFADFKNKKVRCKTCSTNKNTEKQRKDLSFIRDFIDQNTTYTLISKEYTNNKSPIELQCDKHGLFITNWNRISSGVGCKNCATIISKQHQQILDYVKNVYQGDVVVNDRSILEGKELDIYIPEKNFGIEFDGLYWHSEKIKPNIKKINQTKSQIVQDKKINFLAIYEDEWANPVKQELIKAMIRNRLGIKPLHTKRASKLSVKKLTKNKDFKHFFDTYHLDGHVNASFAYGLFDGEKLISCMSFRKSFSDKEWEIARFATDYNYKVHGNAGKLVAEFKKEYNAKLVTYSNNRLSHGDVYEKLGFKNITKTTSPSYYYTDFKVRLWRFKCKRDNTPEILEKFPTEKQQAEGGVFSEKHLGHKKCLYRIYDYGHKKWFL